MSLYRTHLTLASLAAFAAAITWVQVRRPGWLIVLGLALTWTACVVIARDLRDLRARLREREGRCPHCGYDLRESRTRCPECGNVHSSRSD
jgi:hypothetical protein